MSKMLKTWLERVEADEIEPGKIRQFCTGIIPRSMGYTNAGHATNLTSVECGQIVEAFDERVRRDGGPLVTAEQAQIGRVWLQRMFQRVQMPAENYMEVVEFRFVDALVLDETRWRASVAAEYDAYFPDGRVLRYAPTSWQSGPGSKYPSWSWLPPRVTAQQGGGR